MERNLVERLMRILPAVFLVASLAALSACGGGGGGGGAAPATKPGAFVLSAPSGTSIVPTPTLSWTAATGATLYSVEVSTSPVFSTLTTSVSTSAPATSLVVSGLSPSTTYYWRAAAVNSIGTTTATPASLQFTTKMSGEVAWSKTSEPSFFANNAFGLKTDGTNMYIVGYDTILGDKQFRWRAEKRTILDGNPVDAFGISGAIVSSTTWTGSAYAVAIDASAMYIAGYETQPIATDTKWRIEKRDLTTGLPVLAFGGGAVSENPNVGAGADDRIYAMAVDSNPTGTIYAVGFVSPSGTVTEWRIESRSKVDGSLGSSVTTTIGSGDSVPNALVIDETEGYMYVVGSDGSGFSDTKWRIEKRSLSAPLSLETATFGVGGVVINNPGSGVDEAMAVAIDANYLYIAGSQWDTGNAMFMWRMEKRDRFTGALETTTFGSSTGSVNSNTTTDAIATAIAIDATHMYVAGYDNTSGDSLEWRIEKRDLTTGDLDTSFGAGGVYLNSFSNADVFWDDDIWSISVDDSYIYVAGSEAWPNTSGSRWRIEKIVK